MRNSLLFFTVVLFLLFAQVGIGGTYGGGSGTEEFPFLIANVADWEEFADTPT